MAASRGDEGEILRQRRGIPRHLLAARGAGDADAGAVQRFLSHQIGGADSLSSSRTNRLWSVPLSGMTELSARRIHHHQRTVRCR